MKVKTFSRRDIAMEVRDLLELPTGNDLDTSPAMHIVNAVIKAIVNGLERDGRVSVAGFGTFYIKTYPPRKCRVTYYTKPRDKSPGKFTEMVIIPERKKVVFRPNPALKEFVNQGYEEKDES